MDNKKRIIYEVVIISLCLLIVSGFLIVRNKIQTNKLKKEIHEVASLDLGKYKFNKELKCSGNYAVVEEAIKTYLSDYTTTFEEVNNIMNDEKLTNILSVNNYKEDAPEFKESLKYLNSKEKEYTKKIDFLIKSSDKVYNYIYKYTKDRHYIKLYRNIISEEAIDSKTTKYKDDLIKHKEDSLKVFKYSNDIINFLVTNKGKWKIDGNVIKFDNTDLLNAYNGALKAMGK